MASSGVRVVGVFPDRRQADLAADSAVRAGADPAGVTVGNEDDAGLSVQAEMQEEMDHSVAGPAIGVYTEEMTKGIAVAVPIATVIGIVVGLAFAAIPWSGWHLVTRVIVFGLVGAVLGATVGFMIGGGLGASGPGKRLAAERGVVVSALAPDGAPATAIARSMAEHHPIRVDVIDLTGTPRMGSLEAAGTVEDRDEPTLKGQAETLAQRLRQHDGDLPTDHPEEHQGQRRGPAPEA